MKKVIGFLILMIVLVAVSGCTQQTKTAPVTTAVPTTVPVTEATTVATEVPTTEVPVATTEVTTAVTIEANVTAPADTAAVPTVTPTMSMTPSTKVTVIHLANSTFTPSVLMVLPGTGITWVNDNNAIHSVKMIGDHAGMFNSGDLASGGRWGYTFSENEGTYQYADGYDLNATGTIIVKKGDSFVGNVASATPYVTSNTTW
jgi:plastocyanin